MAGVSLEMVLERYGGLLRAFQDRVGFVVLGRLDEKLEAQARATRLAGFLGGKADDLARLTFCSSGDLWGQGLASWAYSEFVQDAFLVLEDELGHPVLLEGASASQSNSLAWHLAASLDCHLKPGLLDMEGGNILIGDDYALIGKNTLLGNLGRATRLWGEPAQAHLEHYLRHVLGMRQVIWLGLEDAWDAKGFVSNGKEAFQPFFHLDLFITLLGKDEEGKELVMLAEVAGEHVQGLQDSDLSHLAALNLRLDEVAQQLAEVDVLATRPIFKVIRNKIGGRIIQSEDGRRKFLPYAHNNALVECFDGIKRIFLPSFPNQVHLQASLARQLSQLGFGQVHFIEHAFEFFAHRGGSLHCLSVVLRRERG
jgi:hypothetical protein